MKGNRNISLRLARILCQGGHITILIMLGKYFLKKEKIMLDKLSALL